MYELDTLSRIALDYAHVIAPLTAVLILIAANRWGSGWPDLWRARRVVLPHLADVGAGEYDDELEDLSNWTGVDAEALGDPVPEKTRLPLLDRELAGVVDAPPREVRAELRGREHWLPCWLASIQYDVVDGHRVYEVGSYAYRSEGLLDEYQVHVRLTPRDGGRKTALWAHREYSPWRRPIKHYRGVEWSAEEGVQLVRSALAIDPEE